MSYSNQNLSVLAYANNFTLWHYTTADESIAGEGYFNNANDMLRKNDLIIASYDTDGLNETKLFVVTGNENNVVKISTYS